MNKRRNTINWIFAVLYPVIGAVVWGFSIAGKLDSFWGGLGGGLIAVGALRLVRLVKYNRNVEYREKVDTENSDERNRFISGKAWAWAAYIYMLAAAVGTLAFHLTGRQELSYFCSMSLCALLVLYWGAYLILRRKY